MRKSDELYKEKSKERLLKIGQSKIRTTMIGAIASMEKNFGHLWNHGGEPRTQEEEELRDAFEDFRSEVLDKGNAQIRNLETELSNYDVNWLRWSITLPVVRRGQ